MRAWILQRNEGRYVKFGAYTYVYVEVVQKGYHIYPRTVRQSGFKITCTKDVTINVESKPLAPCTNTGLPS